MQAFKNLVNGQWVDASDGAVFERRNPAQIDQVLGTFPRATRRDVQQAIEAAREALRGWAGMPAPARGAILYKASQLIDARIDELAAALTQEEGKTLAESRGEVARARDIFRYYGGEGWRMGGDVLPSNVDGELLYTRREPLGVVSIITPWNFPIAIPAWKIAPALVYGNTVVFKPASYAPRIGLMLVECLVEAGLPQGVVNVLTGAGSIVGDEMAGNPGIDGVNGDPLAVVCALHKIAPHLGRLAVRGDLGQQGTPPILESGLNLFGPLIIRPGGPGAKDPDVPFQVIQFGVAERRFKGDGCCPVAGVGAEQTDADLRGLVLFI